MDRYYDTRNLGEKLKEHREKMLYKYGRLHYEAEFTRIIEILEAQLSVDGVSPTVVNINTFKDCDFKMRNTESSWEVVAGADYVKDFVSKIKDQGLKLEGYGQVYVGY